MLSPTPILPRGKRIKKVHALCLEERLKAERLLRLQLEFERRQIEIMASLVKYL